MQHFGRSTTTNHSQASRPAGLQPHVAYCQETEQGDESLNIQCTMDNVCSAETMPLFISTCVLLC